MRSRRRQQDGFTLLETMIAALVLVIAAAGILGLFGIAITQNSVQGDHGTRTVEYAQDKMEQLMALDLQDTLSDVTQYPTCLASVTPSCTGTGLTAGGSINPATPVTGYSDYIDANGNPTAVKANGVYIREWLITNDANTPTQLKTITVYVQKISNVKGIVPSTTLVSQKSGVS